MTVWTYTAEGQTPGAVALVFAELHGLAILAGVYGWWDRRSWSGGFDTTDGRHWRVVGDGVNWAVIEKIPESGGNSCRAARLGVEA